MKVQTLKVIKGKLVDVIEEVSDEQVIDNRSRKEKIIDKIREKYSVDDEIAIIRQKETKKTEFNEYYNYVEQVKKEIV